MSDQAQRNWRSPFRRMLPILAILGAVALLGLWTIDRPPSSPSPTALPVIDLETAVRQAERGDAEAQKILGSIYASGNGIEQDYAKAALWYRKAAEQGHAAAQTALAELHEAGQGVPHDEAEAARWYRRAAEQGHVGGQYALAVLYVMGKGVPRNIAEAVQWYRRAADQGNALAQYNLGMRYRDGDGIPHDPVEAYRWLNLAAAQELQDAVRARDDLKRRLTREQIAESQRRATSSR